MKNNTQIPQETEAPPKKQSVGWKPIFAGGIAGFVSMQSGVIVGICAGIISMGILLLVERFKK